MKISKVMIVGALVLSLADMGQAATIIRFTGSSAFRAAAHNAILHALGTTVPDTGTVLSSGSYCYTGSSLGSASQANFYGTLNGTDVIIKTSWSGSEAGFQTVAQDGTGINVNFLADNIACVAAGTSSVSAGTAAAIPDVAMTDTYQATSRFNSSASIAVSGTIRTFAALTPANSGYADGVVGVQPFVWLASIGGKISTSGTITNMTAQMARALFKVGRTGSGQALQLSMFTGNNSDSSFWVFPVGRNLDSGTRLNEFAETGLGALFTPTQYQPILSGTTTAVTAVGSTIGSVVLWPATTTNGISESKGTSGYSSGGQLVGALGSNSSTMTTPKGTGGILVGYISSGDSGTATAAGARELTYEGIPFSLTAVREGQYTAWCYEHMYYRTGSPIASLADTIAVKMATNDAPVLMSTMNCSRTVDGGVVTHN